MPHALVTLLATALLTTTPLTTVFAQAADAQVFIVNASDIGSPVNFYVDGVLVARSMSSGDTNVFAKSVTMGRHRVVVTFSNRVPGEEDVLNVLVDVPAGSSTLTLANMTGLSVNGYVRSQYDLEFSSAPACGDIAGTMCG